jgi:cobalt-precorrin-5B (C1)-methyltransferase
MSTTGPVLRQRTTRMDDMTATADDSVATGASDASNLRSGYTTGACAAAAARAAVRALITGRPVEWVSVDLPVGRTATFHISRCEVCDHAATCGTIKDAGDDPDVTNGAEILATAEWTPSPGVQVAGGPGVGVVTRAGLAVPVGQPAINPTPRRIIVRAVQDELAALASGEKPAGDRGVRVTISVPNGEALAAQTLNPRLGIVGGISILGTTGIVRPFSAAAYRATIHVALRVASRNGIRRVVLTTGARSEAYARRTYPRWPELSFVEIGDHVGYALTQAARLDFRQIVLAGMIGKLSKVAQGRWQTHVERGGVDIAFLADLAAECGATPELVARCRKANTAHHIQVLLRREGITGLEQRLATLAATQISQRLGGTPRVEVLLYAMDGTLLGRANAYDTLPLPDALGGPNGALDPGGHAPEQSSERLPDLPATPLGEAHP